MVVPDSIVAGLSADYLAAADKDAVVPDRSYVHKPKAGKKHDDVTAFHPGQRELDFSLYLPDILYQLDPLEENKVLLAEQAEPLLDINSKKQYGYAWIGKKGKIVKERVLILDYPILPRFISSNVERARVVFWVRMDPRIKWKDILARFVGSRHTPKKFNANQLQMSCARWRQKWHLKSWGRHTVRTDQRTEPRGAVSKPDKAIDAKLSKVQRLANTTRGLTPGLINPALGPVEGNIIHPPNETGAADSADSDHQEVPDDIEDVPDDEDTLNIQRLTKGKCLPGKKPTSDKQHTARKQCTSLKQYSFNWKVVNNEDGTVASKSISGIEEGQSDDTRYALDLSRWGRERPQRAAARTKNYQEDEDAMLNNNDSESDAGTIESEAVESLARQGGGKSFHNFKRKSPEADNDHEWQPDNNEYEPAIRPGRDGKPSSYGLWATAAAETTGREPCTKKRRVQSRRQRRARVTKTEAEATEAAMDAAWQREEEILDSQPPEDDDKEMKEARRIREFWKKAHAQMRA